MPDKGKKTIIGLGLGGLAIGAIFLATKKPDTEPPPPIPGAFTIKIINLPTGADQWGCAFQDPATGEYHQPTNRPPMGSHLFNPSESAELSSPVDTGILSISAFAQVSAMTVTQIINYQINMSITEGGIYIFDFSTSRII